MSEIVTGFSGLATEVRALREVEHKFVKMLVYVQQLEAKLEIAGKSSGQDLGVAVFASYFALQVLNRQQKGDGALDDEDLDAYAAQAQFIAAAAVKRVL